MPLAILAPLAVNVRHEANEIFAASCTGWMRREKFWGLLLRLERLIKSAPKGNSLMGVKFARASHQMNSNFVSFALVFARVWQLE